jgi:hypothetical protein
VRPLPLAVGVSAVLLAGVADAHAHSILRYSGSDVTYVAEDATSANQLTVRAAGQDIHVATPLPTAGSTPARAARERSPMMRTPGSSRLSARAPASRACASTWASARIARR